MDLVLSGNVWKQVGRWAKAAKRRLAAIAYVSDDRHSRLRQNDVLVWDASDGAIKERQTSAHVLRSLFRRGVEVRHFPDLHAKVAVFGSNVLIGSCNLSGASAQTLTELAFFTNRKQIVAQTMAFIHGLREKSKEIDNAFLARILKIKPRSVLRTWRKRQRQVSQIGNKAWLVSVKELPASGSRRQGEALPS